MRVMTSAAPVPSVSVGGRALGADGAFGPHRAFVPHRTSTVQRALDALEPETS
jgi:hypothetical protein